MRWLEIERLYCHVYASKENAQLADVPDTSNSKHNLLQPFNGSKGVLPYDPATEAAEVEAATEAALLFSQCSQDTQSQITGPTSSQGQASQSAPILGQVTTHHVFSQLQNY